MRKTIISCIAMAFLASACGASFPVPAQRLADAQSAERSATELGATSQPAAKLHLKLAGDQIAQAKTLINDGENKRADILQMDVLRQEIEILDETESGLEIDALRIVAEGVNALAGPELGVLLITHYHLILNYIKPQFVHVLVDGRVG